MKSQIRKSHKIQLPIDRKTISIKSKPKNQPKRFDNDAATHLGDNKKDSILKARRDYDLPESGIEVGKSQKPCKREMKEDVGINQSTRENEKEFR